MEAKQTLNIDKIKKDFAILQSGANGKPLLYLDNGATSLTPDVVLDAMNDYYKNYNANVHRGTYFTSEKATREYEFARKKVAKFINAKTREIIFTKGTTESLNLLAYSLCADLKKGDEVVISQMEHHSNLVPWQQLAKQKGFVVKYIEVTGEGRLDMDSAKKIITNKTKIVSATHVSNVLGTVNDVKCLARLAHDKRALFVIDGAQAAPHLPLDVKDIDCDFYCFSGHKMMGPTGIGVLYGKEELLERMRPFLYGGDMISEVSFNDSSWNELPWKFEAGTPNIAGAIGLGAAVDYLINIGMENIENYEKELLQYALEKLKAIKGVILYGPKEVRDKGGVISFNVNGVHSHDVSAILDREGIAIRGGHLCAMPLVKDILYVNDVCRVSFSFYNTTEDIDELVRAIENVKELFKV